MRNINLPTLMCKDQLILDATIFSDISLNNTYNYGLSTDKNSFGYLSNRLSAIFALDCIINDNQRDIESIAAAVHDGWSYAVYNVDDPKYLNRPEKYTNRLILAKTSYSDLNEQEKEKDRVVAKSILNFLDFTRRTNKYKNEKL